MTPPGLQRVLLVGFMGSGKTSVGKRVAAGLGWRFIDFDEAIEAASGCSVAEIFALRGEKHFRALEERVAERLLGKREVVLGSGGGWAAVSDRLRTVPSGTVTVWLKVSADEAVRRASSEPGRRPLLEGADPLGEARRLLAARAAHYGQADWTVDTDDSSVEDVTARILEILAEEYPEAGAE